MMVAMNRPLIKFHKNQPEMQVFATYAYKQEHAEAMKGHYVDAAKRMTSAMMEGPDGEKREVLAAATAAAADQTTPRGTVW
jgi:hypothetical protein